MTLAQTPAGQKDPLFAAMPETFLAQESHGDVVTELPPGAVVLAENEHWDCQAFVLGDAIWGTQFHPEFTPRVTSDLIHSLTKVLPPEAFPRRPHVQPLKEWLLSSIQDSPVAQRCLENFAAIALQRSGVEIR